jgi:GT2 family glycosyltransferase
MKPEILTIVVTYNAMKWLDRCLGSLSESEVPTDVIVIDNGSVDGTCEYIAGNYPDVLLTRSEENLGFGKANNVGFRYALEHQYRYVYLMNQDAWVYKDTLSVLTSAMDSDSSIGILSPMQMTASGDRPDMRFEKKCPAEALEDISGPMASGKVYETKFVMAAHWMISRECLQKVGGFSPAFPHYGEDDNFIHRARLKGFRVCVHSGTKAIHDREMRPQSKEASMRLKCVASVVKVSNPLNCLWLRLLFQPIELISISLRYSSWPVFQYVFTLIGSYCRLIRLRRESFEDGAFLKSFE